MKNYLGPARVPFLALPPVCVLLGISTAYWQTGRVNLWYALLALIGAVSSHISVNALNEYMDFRSGLDAKTTLNVLLNLFPPLFTAVGIVLGS